MSVFARRFSFFYPFLNKITATLRELDIDDKGNIYVNDKLLEEPYIKKKARGMCDITLPVTVPENALFVLGDKRAVSVDSRSSDVGMIFSERIIGKIVFIVWDFDSFGPMN